MKRTAHAAAERRAPLTGSHHHASQASTTLSASSPTTPDATNGSTPAAIPSRSITPARQVPMPTWAAVSTPSVIHTARDRVRVISDEDVVAELEHAGAGEPLDAVGDVKPQVLELEAARADAPIRIVAPLGDPLRRDARVRAGKRLEQRDPVQVALRLLARRALAARRIDGVGCLE